MRYSTLYMVWISKSFKITKPWPREENSLHTVYSNKNKVILLTLLKIAIPIACKNSFVFSGSWPATIFDGRTGSCPFIIPTLQWRCNYQTGQPPLEISNLTVISTQLSSKNGHIWFQLEVTWIYMFITHIWHVPIIVEPPVSDHQNVKSGEFRPYHWGQSSVCR